MAQKGFRSRKRSSLNGSSHGRQLWTVWRRNSRGAFDFLELLEQRISAELKSNLVLGLGTEEEIEKIRVREDYNVGPLRTIYRSVVPFT